MSEWLKDWWRGWSDADLDSARLKLASNKIPGGVVFLTKREIKAVNDNYWIPDGWSAFHD